MGDRLPIDLTEHLDDHVVGSLHVRVVWLEILHRFQEGGGGGGGKERVVEAEALVGVGDRGDRGRERGKG